MAGWMAGSEAFFGAFGMRPQRGTDPGIAVIGAQPGAAEWAEIESRWLQPSIADLRAGRIAHIMLSAGNRRFSLSRRAIRRFWRRSRPWWEFFQ
jgi:hypothetical protein